MQIVSDPTANRPEQLEDAVQTIGRSQNRFRLFKEIYRGKAQTKSVSFLEGQIGLSKKEVLTAGKVLADGNIVNQVKTPNGETAYEKIRAISHIRAKIIKGVEKPETIKALVTKRRPAPSTEPQIFRTRSTRTTRPRRAKAGSTQFAHRIALLTSSPIGEDPLDVSLEAREIEVERMKAVSRDKFDIRLFPAATTDSLLTAINDYRPAILHFSGHGNLSGLSFDNKTIEDVGGTYVDFGVVSKLLATAPVRPKLIFLNACQSVGKTTPQRSIIRGVSTRRCFLD